MSRKPYIENRPEVIKGRVICYLSTPNKEKEKYIDYTKGYGAIRLDISKKTSIVLSIEDLKRILN